MLVLIPLVALLASSSGSGADSPSASFAGLGDLPGGEVHSEALAVSDDGRAVAGRSSSKHNAEEGFLWTASGGAQALLGPEGVHVGSEPRAIDAKGTILAGKISTGGSLEAARWTASKGWVVLGDLEGGGRGSQVLGMSSDGSVLVGWGTSASGLESARWLDGRASAMGDLAGGGYQSAAAAVSSNGQIVAGTGTTERGPVAFVWTSSAGMVPLGELDGGEQASEPFGISPDGSVIVGKSSSGRGTEAFRWTRKDGLEALGDLPGGEFSSIAFDVAANGTVVGTATTERGATAFVWDASAGMRPLKELLLASGARAVAAWQLTEATGISADGRTIVGNGTNPDGKPEGWIARLP